MCNVNHFINHTPIFHVGRQGEDSQVYSTDERDSGEGGGAYSPGPAVAQEAVSSSYSQLYYLRQMAF